MSEQSIEVTKNPLFVEITGEPATGKTHLSCLFPKPAVFDLSVKGRSASVVQKLFPSNWKKVYFRVKSLEDIRKHLKYIETNKDNYRTVVFDTSADLRSMAATEYLKELNKAGKERQQLMPPEYRWVNEKINEFIDQITDPDGKLGMNLVFIAEMTNEWKEGKPTGRRVRKGFPNANFQSDLRLFLQVLQKVDPSNMQYVSGEYERKCTVIKNGLRNQTDKTEWTSELKDLSWEGIVELTKLKEGQKVE